MQPFSIEVDKMKILIKNINVWKSDSFIKANVIIENDKIGSISTADNNIEAEKIIDGENKYLLPGIIDCHAHSTMVCGKRHMPDFFASNLTDLVLDGAINAERMVRHGITTIRDCGGKYLETLSLRNYINKGKLVGPRILCSGTPIKVIGGHEPGVDVTGPYEARAKVREFIHEGVDFIKVMMTGGLGKAGEDPGAVEMEQEEIDAIVSEAHKHGKAVACHCHSKEGMERLIKAGADSIEHSTYLDAEIDEKILKAGTYVVPTFLPYMNYALLGEQNGQLMDTVLAARAIIGEKKKRFSEAYKKGVNIAFGRDSGGFLMDQGKFVQEMLYMEDAGVTKVDIIKAATENAARLCRVFNETGSIEEGKSADMIILKRNPLDDLMAFEDSLELVFMRGKVLLPQED